VRYGSENQYYKFTMTQQQLQNQRYLIILQMNRLYANMNWHLAGLGDSKTGRLHLQGQLIARKVTMTEQLVGSICNVS
jgi:hypothetical protein